jgi:hypothetical protein
VEIVLQDLISKNPSQKRADGMAQGVSREIKSSMAKKKKKAMRPGMVALAYNPSYQGGGDQEDLV